MEPDGTIGRCCLLEINRVLLHNVIFLGEIGHGKPAFQVWCQRGFIRDMSTLIQVNF